ncbi:hypothetical protein V9T40_003736 [Parthenolecanium corni]|uniref:Acetyltransferase component of pyruvate dehydrogenase complex n=1 Tax=Parthenolecanium corni TaxID=536013 RepID=A0AAN9YAE1_9HEMI
MSKVLRSISCNTRIPVKLQKNIVRNLSYVCVKYEKQILKNFHENDSFYCRKLPIYTLSKRFYSDDLPSHYKVMLPALSPTMDMGTIVSWAKKEGDKLNEGDLLAEIETDKATMGFETPEEGYLAKILVPAGTREVPIGKLVCIIVEEEKDLAAFKNFVDDSPPTKAAPPPAAPSAQPSPTPSQPKPPPAPIATPSSAPSFAKSSERLFASPLAKRLAAEQGLDLKSVGVGSGLFGSIKAKDLNKASRGVAEASKAVKGDGFEDRPISTVQSEIARAVLQSKQTIPHYYLTVDLSMDEILKLKQKMNKSLEKEGVELTVSDFIIKATALASLKVPEANSAWMDTFIRQYNAVDVRVPISSKKGLISPIVFDADKKGLAQINKEVNNLIAKAEEGSLQSFELDGGTITVSYLGMFNIKSLSTIIVPPQACTLGIGSIQKRLVPDASNGTKVSEIAQFTLSCDHRVVDGAVGAQWLIAFKKLIEEPHNMLL